MPAGQRFHEPCPAQKRVLSFTAGHEHLPT